MIRIASDVWDRLSGQPPTNDTLVARAAVPEATDRLLAALDGQGRRHLLVLLQPSNEPFDDRKSRGIEVATRDLTLVDGTRGRYLDLVCREPLGFDVFDAMGGELASALASGVEQPAEITRRLIGKWRRFWLTQPIPSLSREEQLGLFAEFWFLAFWLIPRVGAAQAIDAWRGPLGSRHDIELPGSSVEVKACASATGRIHFIHGLDQLSPPEAGRLRLFSLSVREEGGGQNTLASLVERVRELASTDEETIVRFETRLVQAGYTTPPAWESLLRLRVVDERLYEVVDGFPRITRLSFANVVPPGVEGIGYTINLAGFDSYIIATTPDKFALS